MILRRWRRDLPLSPAATEGHLYGRRYRLHADGSDGGLRVEWLDRGLPEAFVVEWLARVRARGAEVPPWSDGAPR